MTRVFQMMIVALLFLVSCSEKTSENMETVFGKAQNSPDGALIRNKSGVFIIEGKKAWESEYLDKRLKVTGMVVYAPAPKESSYNGHSLQTRTVRNASFELSL